MTAAQKIDYALIPVIGVARELLGEETRERSTATEKHFPDRGGLFVNIKKNRWYSHGNASGTVAPHSEADPVAILLQMLTVAGNIFGRNVYYQVESDRHHANLFIDLVGQSSKARKGRHSPGVPMFASNATLGPVFAMPSAATRYRFFR